MATVAFLGAEAWLGGVARHLEAASLQLSYESAEKDTTTFGVKGTHRREGTRKDARLQVSGFLDVTVDDFADMGGSQTLLYVPAPSAAGHEVAEGDVAYGMNAQHVSFSMGAGVGEVAPFSLDLANRGTTPLGRGFIVSKSAGSVTGEVQPVTALPDNASGTVGIAVLVAGTTTGGSGGTYTLTVDSDSDVGFGSATSRHAPGAVVTSGTEHSALTDLGTSITGEDFWRATITTNAACTTLLVAVLAYIP